MSTIGKLFGRSPFSQLQQHMFQVGKCVEKMCEALDALQNGESEKLDVYATEVSQLEHQADQIKTDVRNRLLRRFFMPMDRSDVLEILSLQDSIADTAEDVCVVLTMKELPFPESIRDDFINFRDLNLKAFNIVAEIINELDELIESGFGGAEAEKIRSMAHDAAFAEHQCDLVQIQLLKKIYALDDSMSTGEFHLWMRVTRVLGRISNLAENLAGSVLKTLSLK